MPAPGLLKHAESKARHPRSLSRSRSPLMPEKAAKRRRVSDKDETIYMSSEVSESSDTSKASDNTVTIKFNNKEIEADCGWSQVSSVLDKRASKKKDDTKRSADTLQVEQKNSRTPTPKVNKKFNRNDREIFKEIAQKDKIEKNKDEIAGSGKTSDDNVSNSEKVSDGNVTSIEKVNDDNVTVRKRGRPKETPSIVSKSTKLSVTEQMPSPSTKPEAEMPSPTKVQVLAVIENEPDKRITRASKKLSGAETVSTMNDRRSRSKSMSHRSHVDIPADDPNVKHKFPLRSRSQSVTEQMPSPSTKPEAEMPSPTKLQVQAVIEKKPDKRITRASKKLSGAETVSTMNDRRSRSKFVSSKSTKLSVTEQMPSPSTKPEAEMPSPTKVQVQAVIEKKPDKRITRASKKLSGAETVSTMNDRRSRSKSMSHRSHIDIPADDPNVKHKFPLRSRSQSVTEQMPSPSTKPEAEMPSPTKLQVQAVIEKKPDKRITRASKKLSGAETVSTMNDRRSRSKSMSHRSHVDIPADDRNVKHKFPLRSRSQSVTEQMPSPSTKPEAEMPSPTKLQVQAVIEKKPDKRITRASKKLSGAETVSTMNDRRSRSKSMSHRSHVDIPADDPNVKHKLRSRSQSDTEVAKINKRK